MNKNRTKPAFLWEYNREDTSVNPIINLPEKWCLLIDYVEGQPWDEEGEVEFYAEQTSFLKFKATQEGLACEFVTDVRKEPLSLIVPSKLVYKEGEHSILFCYHGHRVSLYFDGGLVDEEWPLGSFGRERLNVRILHKGIKRITISDDFEQENLIIQTQKSIVETKPLQYWTPPGYNTRVGDCMPFYHDGQFHLYYLIDRRGHKSKWNLGAHQWAHISTRDLKTWEIHPLAVAITHQWEGSICTGSVIHENGLYYAFYAVRMSDRSKARITYAKSSDGIHFEKSRKYICLNLPYEPVSARDPMVFKGQDNLYHMLVTTELAHPKYKERNGCLAHLVSEDLEDWEQKEPFIVPGFSDQPECSDYFYMNGWYYLIFSNYGVAKYRMSRKPFGPWIKPEVDVIDGYRYRVPKTAAYKDNRRLAVGFLAKSANEYAGCAVFREIIQKEDGTLATAFPEELMPQFKTIKILADEILVDGVEGYSSIDFSDLPDNFRLSFEVLPSTSSMYYGIELWSDSNSKKEGYELRFDPIRSKVGLHKINSVFLKEDEWQSLYNVSGLNTKTKVEIIIYNDIFDICINNERTMVQRISKNDKFTGVSIFTMCGSVRFCKIELDKIVS